MNALSVRRTGACPSSRIRGHRAPNLAPTRGALHFPDAGVSSPKGILVFRFTKEKQTSEIGRAFLQ